MDSSEALKNMCVPTALRMENVPLLTGTCVRQVWEGGQGV